MPTDYSIFYKDAFADPASLAASFSWDVFLSAYNASERVQSVFNAVLAAEKRWLVHNEYGFVSAELAAIPECYVRQLPCREDEFIQGLLGWLPPLNGVRFCVDITGFMRPHLMFLLVALATRGVRTFDAVYAEPAQYTRSTRTVFAHGSSDVRTVAGFEGTHQPTLGSNQDVLVIASGYEHELIRSVAAHKNATRKLQLMGFPPLQADFYQENVLNAQRAAEAVSTINDDRPLFAPAYDPFVTASVLRDTIERHKSRGVENFYLSPISSKPHALGFALYYIWEATGTSTSIIYPFSPCYSRESATGIARVWRFRIELP